MEAHSSFFDCFYESMFHETRKDGFLKIFAETRNDRERISALLTLPSARNLMIPDLYDGKSSLKSDILLEEAVSRGKPSDSFTMAILAAPESSTAEASAYVCRGAAFLSNGDPHAAIVDSERALQLENLLEPMEIFQAFETLSGALCITKQWDRAECVLNSALQKLRTTNMANAAKALIVGKFIPLLKQAKAMVGGGKGKRDVLVKPVVSERDLNIVDDMPNVSYGINPCLPAASVAVKFMYSKDKGRHLVAARDLRAGDIVIVEEPFAWTTRNLTALKTHCLHCLRRSRAPISCKHCSMVCYCSSNCRDESWLQYHQYECSILNHFYDSKELSEMALLAYRTVVSAGHDALSMTIGSPTKPTPAAPYRSQDYKSVYWQESHADDRTTEDLLKRTLTCVFLLRCLQKVSFLHKSMSETEMPSEEELVVGSALLRHLQSCSCNAYEITETLIGGERGVRNAEPLALGGAVYPTVSLLNHSCSGNLARHSVNGKYSVVRAAKNIRSGDELLDNYGVYYVNSPLEARLAALQRQYFFKCSCDACVGLWETFDKLKPTRYKCVNCGHQLGPVLNQIKSCPKCNKGDYTKVKKNLYRLSKVYSDALQDLLDCNANKALKALSSYYEELEKYVVVPCKELIKCQQAMNQCWSLLGNIDQHL